MRNTQQLRGVWGQALPILLDFRPSEIDFEAISVSSQAGSISIVAVVARSTCPTDRGYLRGMARAHKKGGGLCVLDLAITYDQHRLKHTQVDILN